MARPGCDDRHAQARDAAKPPSLADLGGVAVHGADDTKSPRPTADLTISVQRPNPMCTNLDHLAFLHLSRSCTTETEPQDHLARVRVGILPSIPAGGKEFLPESNRDSVYRSSDASDWTRQSEACCSPRRRGRQGFTAACRVVVRDRRLFYFTHPGRRPDAPKTDTEQRRSSIQVVELKYKDGQLTCDRNEPTHIRLTPPDSR